MRATASLRIWFSPSSGVDLRQESYRPSVSGRCRPPSIWYRVYRALLNNAGADEAVALALSTQEYFVDSRELSQTVACRCLYG